MSRRKNQKRKNKKIWNPTGRARGTIYGPPSPKDGYGETSAMWSRFHLAEARLRLPPRVKPVVPGGGGWRKGLDKYCR